MMKKWTSSLVCMCLLLTGGVLTSADDQNEIYKETVRKGEEAQWQMTDGALLTEEEVKDRMDPLFTDKFIDQFLNEGMMEDNGRYFIPGSDFPVHFIPHFEYGKEMKYREDGNQMVLYEEFPAFNEGPVSYNAHYEAVYLVFEDEQWKVDRIDYEYEPERDEAKEEKREPLIGSMLIDDFYGEEQQQMNQSSQSFWNSIKYLFSF
ncbi:MAG: DUF3993 domain-containing protein [Bacillus sp. (in: firmicutes)]